MKNKFKITSRYGAQKTEYVLALMTEHYVTIFGQIKIIYRLVTITSNIVLHKKFSTPNEAIKWIEKNNFYYEEMEE